MAWVARRASAATGPYYQDERSRQKGPHISIDYSRELCDYTVEE